MGWFETDGLVRRDEGLTRTTKPASNAIPFRHGGIEFKTIGETPVVGQVLQMSATFTSTKRFA